LKKDLETDGKEGMEKEHIKLERFLILEILRLMMYSLENYESPGWYVFSLA